MKKNPFLLLFATLLCACGGGNEPEEVDPPVVPDPGEQTISETLKIMSFNMRNQQSSDTGDRTWDLRKFGVKEMINDIKPDVIALQECAPTSRSWYKNIFGKEYGFIDNPATVSSSGSGGNACIMYRLDRFELVKSGAYFLSYTPDEPSKCFNVGDTQWRCSAWIHLKEKATGKEVCAMSTHLPVRPNSNYDNAPYIEARELGARLNVTRMKEIAGNDCPVFIAGDMNCAYKTSSGSTSAPGNQVLSEYTTWLKDSRDYNNITPAGIYSYNAFGDGTPNPSRDIDFIFFRKADPVQFETVTTQYGNVPYISDHYPIMFTVKF